MRAIPTVYRIVNDKPELLVGGCMTVRLSWAKAYALAQAILCDVNERGINLVQLTQEARK